MLPITILTAAWLAGIFGQGWLELPGGPLWVGVGGGIGLAIIGQLLNRQSPGKPRFSVLLPLTIAAFGLGALRLLWAAPSTGPDSLRYYISERETTVIGVVSAEPTYGATSESFRVSVRQIRLKGAERPLSIGGELYVRGAGSLSVSRGDLLELTGPLLEPQELSGESFPYRQWLARQNIYTTMSYPRTRTLAIDQEFFLTRWLYTLNQNIQQTILDNVPGEEGRVLVSVLLGGKQYLSNRTRLEFTISGVLHILVVSGTNVTILVSMVTLVLSRFFQRRTVLVVALATILFYVLLVGPSPPILRAGIMGAVAVIGLLLGRENTALGALTASAFLMTLWQPYALMDISFQLSFMATLGLVILAQPWQAQFSRWPPILREGIITTIAAEVMLLPLLAFYFHQLSLVSLLTNSLVLPVVPLVMLTGGLVVLAGAGFGGWLPFVAQFFGGIAWLFMAYMLVVVGLCATLPFASVGIADFHPVWLFIYYFLLGSAIWWWRSGRKHPFGQQLLVRMSSQVGLLVGVGLAVAVWVVVWLI